jgi:hypothetical protein
MTAAQTVTFDGMTYGMDEHGNVKWATYAEPQPRPEIPPEVWRTQTAWDAAQAWNATLAACRGQR